MPRVYLATPEEIAERLRQTAKGRGDTILFEYKAWTKRAYAAGTIDKIPQEWEFSSERIQALFNRS